MWVLVTDVAGGCPRRMAITVGLASVERWPLKGGARNKSLTKVRLSFLIKILCWSGCVKAWTALAVIARSVADCLNVSAGDTLAVPLSELVDSELELAGLWDAGCENTLPDIECDRYVSGVRGRADKCGSRRRRLTDNNR